MKASGSSRVDVINRFYGGRLEAGCDPDSRRHYLHIDGVTRNLIRDGRSVLFVNCDGRERRESGSTSVVNDLEAETVARLVKLIDGACRCNSRGNPLGTEGEEDMTMGVITPYADQMRAIRRRLHMGRDDPNRLVLKGYQSEGEERFMVKSVDDFQGDERDVIILSLVRTTSSRFISDFRRINVAMSRARRLLVIVGKASALETERVDIGDGRGPVNVYAEIINDLKERDSYVDSSEIPEASP